MTPLAQEMAASVGCFAPWQSARSVQGQVDELKAQIEDFADAPVTLVGHSWGGWLVWFFAAQHPDLVKKLILVAPGVFEDAYARNLMPTRLGRLSQAEREAFDALMVKFHDPNCEEKDSVFAAFGKLMQKADTFDEIEMPEYERQISYEIYNKVWPEADKLRKSGELLKLAKQIKCSVTAILGDYDSTPVAGVEEPLSRTLDDFNCIVLENCGHYPWFERQAKEKFLSVLLNELI